MRNISDKKIEKYLEDIRENWRNIENIPKEVLIQYPQISIEAFIQNASAIEYIPDKVLIEYPRIGTEALKQNIEYIDWIPDEILRGLKDPEICIKVVKQDAWLVEFFSKDLLIANPQIGMEAVKKEGKTIVFLPEEVLIKYPQIAMEAVKKNKENIEYIPDEVLKKYPQISAEGIKHYGKGIKYIYDNNEAEALLIAARENRAILYFVNENMKHYILARLNEETKNDNWQEDCFNVIKNQKNVVLSSPTGSGKTRVYLEWAKQKADKPIYITSPTKSLTNQRYKELIEAGNMVGIETGDMKNVPDNCDFICCTQEIYTNKYMNQEDVTLIIDEFHYIFENKDRTRTYIDALHHSKAKNILLCSATLGHLDGLKEYLKEVSAREFYIYENKSRLTELYYRGAIKSKKIRNALVVNFSKKNCEYIASEIIAKRKSDGTKLKKIERLAKKYHVECNDNIKKGVATYYGSMLPKEKLFVEELFKNRLVDTVVGTDALALGVNFPVEKVVFTQLAKYGEGPISKNLFEQLAGRAGRKGYFNEGYVYYCDDFKVKVGDYKLDNLYERLIEKENENMTIELLPDIKAILQNKTTIEKEVEYMIRYSTKKLDKEEVRRNLEKTIHEIENYNLIEFVIKEEFHDNEYDNQERDIEEIQKRTMKLVPIQGEFAQNIAEVYFEEFNEKENCEIFRDILLGKTNLIEKYGDSYNKLLQLRKYVISLPQKYRKAIDIDEIEQRIKDMDGTPLNEGRNMLSIDEISKGTQEEQIATDEINKTFKIMNQQISGREENLKMEVGE